jgi:hypothetical protein
MSDFKAAFAGLAVLLKRGGVAVFAATRAWGRRPEAKSRFLIAVGAAAVLAIGLTLSMAHSNELEGQLFAKTTTLDAKTEKVAALSGQLTAARNREAAVAAMEAAQDQRSATLDARESAVKTTEAVVAANTIPGSGTFRVGIDVQPGQYHSEGGSSCYWSRMNAAGDDTIDNYLGAGPAVLTVQATDGLIKTSRCAPFTKSG